jgi:hypothetical protein
VWGTHSFKLLLFFCAFEAGFGFADHDFGVGVFFGVVASLVPKLMTVVEALLGGGGVDLLGLKGTVGEDGHALGQDFDESATDAVDALADLAAMEAYFAGPEDGDQRRVPIEDFEIAVPGRDLDGVGGLVDEDLIGSNEPDL